MSIYTQHSIATEFESSVNEIIISNVLKFKRYIIECELQERTLRATKKRGKKIENFIFADEQ